MHMADALLSPQVGGVMWAVSAGTIAFAIKKIAGKPKGGNAASLAGGGSFDAPFDEKKIPLMGIMGAFVFAAMMINFTIPGTGSSGHICGGILLSALLGPAAGIITLASVLLIQCLFFADGGLLAYGCNVFNMGITGAVLAYTFVFRPIVSKGMTKGRITLASVLSCVIGLEVGAFCVVLETKLSGVTELPFGTFCALMLPIHLAIGFVEGLVTAAILCFVQQARPELLESTMRNKHLAPAIPMKRVLIVFAVLAVFVGGILSWFASTHPDGLEWSISKVTGSTELDRKGPAQAAAANIIHKTAILPDYAFKTAEGANTSKAADLAGTSVSGLVGGIFTLVLACAIGLVIHFARRKKTQLPESVQE
jgi:cobalt/nickel transport system permease protein